MLADFVVRPSLLRTGGLVLFCLLGLWPLLSDDAPTDDAGAEVAKANALSQLVIHRADGTIEDERTYGEDPYPPAG